MYQTARPVYMINFSNVVRSRVISRSPLRITGVATGQPFVPQAPILFKSNSYPPHKRKTSKFPTET